MQGFEHAISALLANSRDILMSSLDSLTMEGHPMIGQWLFLCNFDSPLTLMSPTDNIETHHNYTRNDTPIVDSAKYIHFFDIQSQ
jgi:hypothetical protein